MYTNINVNKGRSSIGETAKKGFANITPANAQTVKTLKNVTNGIAIEHSIDHRQSKRAGPQSASIDAVSPVGQGKITSLGQSQQKAVALQRREVAVARSNVSRSRTSSLVKEDFAKFSAQSSVRPTSAASRVVESNLKTKKFAKSCQPKQVNVQVLPTNAASPVRQGKITSLGRSQQKAVASQQKGGIISRSKVTASRTLSPIREVPTKPFAKTVSPPPQVKANSKGIESKAKMGKSVDSDLETKLKEGNGTDEDYIKASKEVIRGLLKDMDIKKASYHLNYILSILDNNPGDLSFVKKVTEALDERTIRALLGVKLNEATINDYLSKEQKEIVRKELEAERDREWLKSGISKEPSKEENENQILVQSEDCFIGSYNFIKIIRVLQTVHSLPLAQRIVKVLGVVTDVSNSAVILDLLKTRNRNVQSQVLDGIMYIIKCFDLKTDMWKNFLNSLTPEKFHDLCHTRDFNGSSAISNHNLAEMKSLYFFLPKNKLPLFIKKFFPGKTLIDFV